MDFYNLVLANIYNLFMKRPCVGAGKGVSGSLERKDKMQKAFDCLGDQPVPKHKKN